MKTPKVTRKPTARPTNTASADTATSRSPRAFAPDKAESQPIERWLDPTARSQVASSRGKPNWALRLAVSAGGLLISLAAGLALENLVQDLFARYEWLGWTGLSAVGLFLMALIIMVAREILALGRLNKLDALREHATQTLISNKPTDGQKILNQLQVLYHQRPDMADARQNLDADAKNLLDGAQMVKTAEQALMTPLDARAKALTTAAARRVAIVTAISPRAIVDVAFVAYESLKLTRAIATLYGGRPGLLSSWRLAGAILGHLAVTGGVALGDSIIQQLLGQGLAAKLSARLGEGLVNGLMTARVGIAAMRVTRPLPFEVLKHPTVLEFSVELAKITKPATEPTA